jgi:hypothetical protein
MPDIYKDSPKIEKFKEQLDHIIRRELTPENIHGYADEVLSELVDFTNKIDETYSDIGENREERLSILGISSTDEMLDRAIEVDESIKESFTLLQKAETRPSAFVPPDSASEFQIVAGYGGFREKDLIPRTAATLFLLKNDYGINLKDFDELEITKGTLVDDQMRKTSYNMIEAKTLSRIILVCDDEGNRTFVFDLEVLDDIHNYPEYIPSLTLKQLDDFIDRSTSEILSMLTKNQLKELVTNLPKSGRDFIYNSGNFINTLKSSIDNPENTERKISSEKYEPLIEIENISEGEESIRTLSKRMSITYSILANIIKKLDSKKDQDGNPVLSNVIKRFGSVMTRALSTKDQAAIEKEISRKGLDVDLANVNEESISSFSNKKGISKITISKIINELDSKKDKDGNPVLSTVMKKFSGNLVRALNLKDQKIIEDYLKNNRK